MFYVELKYEISFYRLDHLFELHAKNHKNHPKILQFWGKPMGNRRFWVGGNAFFSEYVTKIYVRLHFFELWAKNDNGNTALLHCQYCSEKGGAST